MLMPPMRSRAPPRPGRGLTTSLRRLLPDSSAVWRSRLATRALIIDSWFDNYVGVVMLVRVFDGTLRPKRQKSASRLPGARICEQVGVFAPRSTQRESISAGQKWASSLLVSRNLTRQKSAIPSLTRKSLPPARCPGFKEVKPQVFAVPLSG